MIAYPDSPCWPQACLADYAAAPPELWAATLAVALLAGLGACLPALALWALARGLSGGGRGSRSRRRG